jgi:hypothetical protein
MTALRDLGKVPRQTGNRWREVRSLSSWAEIAGRAGVSTRELYKRHAGAMRGDEMASR